MMKKYYESDADLSVLKGKKIAVIGYGSQGRGQSLNLRDSGLDVIIGLRKGKSWDAAAKDGMTVLSVAEAAKKADIIQILLPERLPGGRLQERDYAPPHREQGPDVLPWVQHPLRPDPAAGQTSM